MDLPRRLVPKRRDTVSVSEIREVFTVQKLLSHFPVQTGDTVILSLPLRVPIGRSSTSYRIATKKRFGTPTAITH